MPLAARDLGGRFVERFTALFLLLGEHGGCDRDRQDVLPGG
jgi:hypothetical protein